MKNRLKANSLLSLVTGVTGFLLTCFLNHSSAGPRETKADLRVDIDGAHVIFNAKPIRVANHVTEYESSDGQQILQTYPGVIPQLPTFAQIEMRQFKILRARKISENSQIIQISQVPNTESLAEYLLRHEILQIDLNDMQTFKLNSDLRPNEVQNKLEKIWSAVQEAQRLALKNGAQLELSPFDLLVRYKDGSKTEIAEVLFKENVFYPRDQKARTATRAPQSPAELLGDFSKKMSEARESGFFRVRTMTFAETQTHTDYVKRTAESGRQLRIAGVSTALERQILKVIQDTVHGLGYELAAAFYFGSRVMPRTDVAAVDPAIISSLPMTSGLQTKNVVRESGLTNISDVEIFLTVYPQQPFGPKTNVELENLGQEIKVAFRRNVSNVTREYPVDLSAVVVSEPVTVADSYAIIDDHMVTEHNRPISKHQYARFYPLSCRDLF